MTTLIEKSQKLWERIRQSPAFLPTAVAIPADHVDRPEGEAFARGRHYFQVRVNEMFLPYNRRWASTYLPMVMALSEFQYNRSVTALPFVVGPSLVEEKGVKIPDNGILFQDTRVAGLVPYAGGRVSTTVVLYRVERENLVRRLLGVVESAASAIDFGVSLGTYVKIASTILDGVDALFETGQVQPLIGFRKEFDPDSNVAFAPGYFALISNEAGNVDPDRLWVKNNRLCYGPSLDAAVSVQDTDSRSNPLQENEFVLYSITQTAERSDLELLPFYPLWERVQHEATQPGAEHYKSAKANMLSLYQTLSVSPDLTEPHAGRLLEEFVQKMQSLHQRAVELDALGMPAPLQGAPDPETIAMDRVIDQAVSILDL